MPGGLSAPKLPLQLRPSGCDLRGFCGTALDRETDPGLQDSAKASGKAPFSAGQTSDALLKGAYLRQATLAEGGGGQAGRFLETRREMLGVTEAGRKGHIDDAVPRFR